MSDTVDVERYHVAEEKQKTAASALEEALVSHESRLVAERAPCGGEHRVYLTVKRMQDVFLSLLALIVLSPLLLLIALVIWIDDPRSGPIFSQVRCGRNGREFKFYKFRTMCTDAEKRLAELLEHNEMRGPVFKLKDDPRITRVGRFLRKTSLDELPQLVNVLKGDMSVVGPRPPLPREVEQYTDYQRQRLSVTPGLTCYWQVQPRRNSLSFDDWVELDIQYIQERNYLLDWKLIFQTVKVMIRGEGI